MGQTVRARSCNFRYDLVCLLKFRQTDATDVGSKPREGSCSCSSYLALLLGSILFILPCKDSLFY